MSAGTIVSLYVKQRSQLLRPQLFASTGRTKVFYRGKGYRIRRVRRYGLIWRRRVRPLTTLRIYIRGKYRPLRKRRRLWYTRIKRRWVRVIRGKRIWYYRYLKRWIKIKRVRLSARVGRRTCRIRPRGRKLYARIGRRLRRLKTRFIRFIRYKGKRLRIRRRGRRVSVYRRRKWSRPLRVKRYRE